MTTRTSISSASIKQTLLFRNGAAAYFYSRLPLYYGLLNDVVNEYAITSDSGTINKGFGRKRL
jgi:hypothetical protein